MLVLDASTALSWLFEREAPPERRRSLEALQRLENEPAVVPALWHAEVPNALLVGERRMLISPAAAAEFLSRLALLPISVDTASPASRWEAVMGLARHHDLTVYDATYLELAMRLGASLASFDSRLAKAAKSVGIEVI